MKYDPENEKRYRATDKFASPDSDGNDVLYQYGISVISDGVIRKQAYSSTRDGFEVIQALCQHFMRHPHPSVVPIYDFQAEAIPKSAWGAHRYHYDMMRMGTLDETEKRFISLVADNWWRHYREPNRELYFEQYLGQNDKLLTLLKRTFLEERYGDVHNGNFMKDEDDNYRIIDLEGFSVHSPLSSSRNDWLRE